MKFALCFLFPFTEGQSAAQQIDVTFSPHRGHLTALQQSSQNQNLDPSLRAVCTSAQVKNTKIFFLKFS